MFNCAAFPSKNTRIKSLSEAELRRRASVRTQLLVGAQTSGWAAGVTGAFGASIA